MTFNEAFATACNAVDAHNDQYTRAQVKLIADHVHRLLSGEIARSAAPFDAERGTVKGRMRTCGECLTECIPYGVDWPWWIDGRPICTPCRTAAFTERVKTELGIKG